MHQSIFNLLRQLLLTPHHSAHCTCWLCRWPMGGFDMAEGKIRAFVHGRDVLVWSANAVISLDKDWRVCSGLVGALPRYPRQNTQHGLPLKLSHEETTLLLEKGVLELLEYTPHKHTDKDMVSFQQNRLHEFEQQYTDYREKREQDRQKYTSTKPETSSEGYRVQEGTEPDLCTPELEQMNRAKRVKFNHSEATRPVEHTQQPKDVQERLSTSRSSFSPLVHIHATDPRPYTSYHLYTSWNYPATDYDKLRYSVYKDLWHRGYSLTSGLKYGGDYLVYQGHPHAVHSSHIAVVLSWKQVIANLVSLGRLGAKVKKSVLLCSMNKSGEIQYLTIQWNMA